MEDRAQDDVIRLDDVYAAYEAEHGNAPRTTLERQIALLEYTIKLIVNDDDMFVVLDKDETPPCDHEWCKEARGWKLINSSDEFVQGYGNSPVFVQDGSVRRCVRCGLIEDDD